MTTAHDDRIDLSWDGPMPRYETAAMIGADVSREELIVYFSHVLAQIIDLSCEMHRTEGREPLRFRKGSPWDQDWQMISSLGMTEAEVSLLLSDMDGVALRNMANISLGVALDKTLADCGPLLVTYTASTLLGIVSECGEEYAVDPDDMLR